MPKLDLNRLAKKVQKSAGDIAKTVSDTAGKLPDMKLENVTSAVKDVSVRERLFCLLCWQGERKPLAGKTINRR